MKKFRVARLGSACGATHMIKSWNHLRSWDADWTGRIKVCRKERNVIAWAQRRLSARPNDMITGLQLFFPTQIGRHHHLSWPRRPPNPAGNVSHLFEQRSCCAFAVPAISNRIAGTTSFLLCSKHTSPKLFPPVCLSAVGLSASQGSPFCSASLRPVNQSSKHTADPRVDRLQSFCHLFSRPNKLAC